jgi:hypothetical protein
VTDVYRKKPYRKTNFLVGVLFVISAVADWKQAGVVDSTFWSIVLYVTAVLVFLVSWGPFSAAARD